MDYSSTSGGSEPLNESYLDKQVSAEQFQENMKVLDGMVAIFNASIADQGAAIEAINTGFTAKDKDRVEQLTQKEDNANVKFNGEPTAKFAAKGAAPTEPGADRVREIPDNIVLGGQREPIGIDPVLRDDDSIDFEQLEDLQSLKKTVRDLENQLRELESAVDSSSEDAVAPSSSFDTEDSVLGGDDDSASLLHFEVVSLGTPSSPATPTIQEIAIRGGISEVIPQYEAGGVVTPTYQRTIGAGGDFHTFASDATSYEETTLSNQLIDIGQTKYVYLEFVGTAAAPTAMQAKWGDSRPTEYVSEIGVVRGTWLQSGTIRVLAKVAMDGSGVLTISQEWQGGNIRHYPIQLDSTDEIERAGSYTDAMNSIGVSEDGLIELYDFKDSATEHGYVPYVYDSASPRRILYAYANQVGGDETGETKLVDAIGSGSSGPGAITGHRYLTVGRVTYLANGGDAPGLSNIDTGTGSAYVDLYGTINDYLISPGILHDQLINMPDAAGTVTDHDKRYWVKGSSYLNCFGTSIGYASGVAGTSILTIDLSGRALSNGKWTVPDTTVAGAGDGCLNLLGGLSAALGAHITDGSRIVTIADGTQAIAATGDIKITGTSGDYWHDNAKGLTAYGHSGGILIDEGVLEAGIIDVVEMYL